VQITGPFAGPSKEFEAAAASNIHSRQLSFDHESYIMTANETRIFSLTAFLGTCSLFYVEVLVIFIIVTLHNLFDDENLDCRKNTEK